MNKITNHHIASFFSTAESVLGLLQQDIQKLYPASEQILKGHDENIKILEVQFPYFILSCMINRDNKCEAAFILLNQLEDMETINRIINHCNKNYDYSYLYQKWIKEENIIELRIINPSVLFVVY